METCPYEHALVKYSKNAKVRYHICACKAGNAGQFFDKMHFPWRLAPPYPRDR